MVHHLYSLSNIYVKFMQLEIHTKIKETLEHFLLK